MSTLRTSVISLGCLSLACAFGCGSSGGGLVGSLPATPDAASGSAGEADSAGQGGLPNPGGATDAAAGSAGDDAGAAPTPAGSASTGEGGGATGSADTGLTREGAAGDAGTDAENNAEAGRGIGSPPDSGSGGDGGVPSPLMSLFVSSDTSMTGNIGGLTGADMRCQRLAAAVGQGGKTWRAYLSADTPVTNARDRIGAGPYYNSLGVMVAADKAALHARSGDPGVFVDEHGMRINGQWNGSIGPALQHDILTGSMRDGTLAAGMTCGSWTATTGRSFVGHSDGMGPMMSMAASYTPWNSSHPAQCANTEPLGGAGRIYCFVGN